MKAFVAAFCGFALATPAVAQVSSGGVTSGSGAGLSSESNAPESSGDANARGSEGEQRICRRVETSSASRMSTRRVCRTAQEWRDSQRSN
jgi:hypothetical protein